LADRELRAASRGSPPGFVATLATIIGWAMADQRKG
jgi:hypothetical protein